jgi:hypothetical protein
MFSFHFPQNGGFGIIDRTPDQAIAMRGGQGSEGDLR